MIEKRDDVNSQMLDIKEDIVALQNKMVGCFHQWQGQVQTSEQELKQSTIMRSEIVTVLKNLIEELHAQNQRVQGDEHQQYQEP